MIKSVPIESLVLDYTIYPRHHVDDENIRSLVLAIQAGVKLPALTADKESRRITDGFHRAIALRKVHGTGATHPTEFKAYPDEAAMLEDAMRLNACHGRKLAPYDQARCLILGEERGLTVDRIAGALSLTVDAIRGLRLKKVAVDPNAKLVPIKKTLGHLAGEQLSTEQIQGNQRAGGMRPLFYVNQVRNLLLYDLVDSSDERLMAGLADLHVLLSRYLDAVSARIAG